MDDFVATAEARLREGGFRLTRARRMVIRALAEADRALSPYGLLEAVRAGGPQPDVVTIYRVLDLLESLHLVHRVHSLNGYVACSHLIARGCHHPLICSRCGRIDEFEVHHFHAMEQSLDGSGWRITGHVLEITGVCPDCLAAAEAAAPNR